MKYLIHGYGKMGQRVEEVLKKEGHEIVAIVDFKGEGTHRSSIHDVTEPFDCLIDFSHHSKINDLIDYLNQHPSRAVIATTDLSSEQLSGLKQCAVKSTLFQSYNTSYGIFVLTQLLQEASRYLGSDFDVSLLDTHHNQKVDRPSGTAKLLLETIDQVHPRPVEVHAFRTGGVYGDHEINFTSDSEKITLKHSALNREIFAYGALKAAQTLMTLPAGYYDLHSLYQTQ